jgi:hypothetical protein
MGLFGASKSFPFPQFSRFASMRARGSCRLLLPCRALRSPRARLALLRSGRPGLSEGGGAGRSLSRQHKQTTNRSRRSRLLALRGPLKSFRQPDAFCGALLKSLTLLSSSFVQSPGAPALKPISMGYRAGAPSSLRRTHYSSSCDSLPLPTFPLTKTDPTDIILPANGPGTSRRPSSQGPPSPPSPVLGQTQRRPLHP